MPKVKRANKTSKIFWIVFTVIVLALGAWFFSDLKADENLHIYFLDVGQGDSIYARRMNNFDLLIDGGPGSKILSELGKIMPFYDHKIDYIILTHPHADHLSGLIEVLRRYEVGQIVATDAVHTTAEYQQWLELIRQKNIPYKLARAGEEINLDSEVKLKILWPTESYTNKNVDNLNNTSVVAKLVYNKFSVLLPGDAEEEVQKELLKAENCQPKAGNCELKADILKVAHHGSSNGSNINFLKAVDPFVAIISVGKDNKFGHPAPDTLKKLDSVGVQTYRTDQNGTIEITSDGQTYHIKTEK